ncbi:B-box zinc finger protein 22-like [Typha angustifolia]|uniref:B-box zinc finger protein 22-like n=1 Tax=Typha angustifolia TaxID=59011 RepID=UPI003C2ADB0E
MKIQCNACDAAEAAVLCCADEAALCWACDEKVHAANKLAGKHQRVPLLAGNTGSPSVPKCDICQEASGYFFCLEDRALLCRNCDVSVHTANPHVTAHQRFLLTGVQVGLEITEPVSSIANEQLNAADKFIESPSTSLGKRSHMSLLGESNAANSNKVGRNGDLPSNISFSGVAVAGNLPSWPTADEKPTSVVGPVESSSKSVSRSPAALSGESTAAFSNQVDSGGGLANKMSFSGGTATMVGSLSDWSMDEFFDYAEFSHNFGFIERGSSKADNAKLGSSEGSPNYRSADEDVVADEYLGQVRETLWTVPEIPSPPTASGLHWQRNLHYPASEKVASVPDICSQRHHNTQGDWLEEF